MVVFEVTSVSEFDDMCDEYPKVIVAATADYGPCTVMEPVFSKLSDQFSEIHFVKVDTDMIQDLGKKMGVEAMPTFIFYKDGNKVHEVEGADPVQLEKHTRLLRSS
ncbi:unnamed protein product [Blumeria hordei]|uniref:Thioredoxin domain-containing protein n=2 Tax=Blumeria hordei TaxID=2867405 RepID=A0A383UI84_BLUHO|nr:thioredoxin TrxA [Blumeria hordei DH14]SZE99531.1 unnamed protein product [Blumeria hordei]